MSVIQNGIRIEQVHQKKKKKQLQDKVNSGEKENYAYEHKIMFKIITIHKTTHYTIYLVSSVG